jgi:hypothetical protein
LLKISCAEGTRDAGLSKSKSAIIRVYLAFPILELIMHDVDVIRDILERTEIAFPESTFIKSLHQHT